MSNLLMAANRWAKDFCIGHALGEFFFHYIVQFREKSRDCVLVRGRCYGSVVQPHEGGDPVTGQFILVCNLAW